MLSPSGHSFSDAGSADADAPAGVAASFSALFLVFLLLETTRQVITATSTSATTHEVALDQRTVLENCSWSAEKAFKFESDLSVNQFQVVFEYLVIHRSSMMIEISTTIFSYSFLNN